MKTIVNCTICDAVIVDSFTMLQAWCKDCGGDCVAYDPETVEVQVEGDDPQQALVLESMGDFYLDELEAHYAMEKDLEFSFPMLPLDDEDLDWWYSHPDYHHILVSTEEEDSRFYDSCFYDG